MADRQLPRPPRTPHIESLPPGDREWLVGVIQGVESRLLAKLGEQDQRIAQMENLHDTIDSLATDVRAVLRSDAQQEHRLSAVEIRMVEASRSAGSRAGVSAGALGSVIAAAILYALQQLSGQQPSPVVPHRPTMPSPVTQPPQ